MERYQHQFRSVVFRIDYGHMAYHGVFLPEALLEALPAARKPGFRIRAEVAGVELNCGLMAVKRSRYILLSNAFLKQAGLRPGQELLVRFSQVAGDAVALPPELEEALARDARAQRLWARLTPGKQRAYVHRIGSAVQEATRRRRVLEVLDALHEGGLVSRRLP